VTRLPRTLRLDPSDTVVFERPAEPGEWAVPGGFAFWDESPESMPGRRRQAFRAGFLGLSGFGWSTLVEVAEATPAEREAAVAALAAHLRAAYGAPDDAAARAAAEEEVAFAESLCTGQPPGTVLALSRDLDAGGGVRERFRTLHRRAGADAPHRDFGALPVLGVVQADDEEEEEPPPTERPDLAAMARGGGGGGAP
jgi:uncharacterized protein DUF6505